MATPQLRKSNTLADSRRILQALRKVIVCLLHKVSVVYELHYEHEFEYLLLEPERVKDFYKAIFW